MRNIGYILKRDFKRILSSWVAVIVILGICVLPSLYAWFNIAANMDPYANTSSIRIAVACQDKGTTEELTGQINVGDKIVEELGNNDSLDWVVMSEDEAIDGVKAGDYYAAIIIPDDFSKKLTGFLHGKVNKPEIDYYVNEKLNAIAPKVTDTGLQVLQETIDTKFKETVSIAIMETLGETAGEITAAIPEDNSRLVNSIDKTREAIGKYQKSIKSFNSTYKKSTSLAKDAKGLHGSVSKSISNLASLIKTNQQIIEGVKTDADATITAIKQFQEEYPDIAHPLTDEILSKLTAIDWELNSADQALTKTSGLIATIKPALSQISTMMDNLTYGLKDTDRAISSMSAALEATDRLLLDARNSINSLESAEAIKDLQELSGMDYEAMAEFLASPINLETEKLYPVENYGSGVAPFFTMLAIWVGGLILIAIFKLEVEVDEEDKRYISMTEAYFARSILFTIIGLIQAAIVCIGDIWLLGIQCLHPLAFLLVGLVASIVFVNLIFALTITFRHIGKALAVLLVILQIPGSSGTYPVELTGDFFQKIYPFLPFSYGVKSLRDAIAGFYGSNYLNGIAMLLLFLLVAFFIGLVMRPIMAPVNYTLDSRLSDTGILNSDSVIRYRENKAVKMAIRMVYSIESYQENFESRVEAFERFHKKIEDVGIRFVFIIPIILLVLVFIVPMKPLMITIWVVCILAVVIFLIMVEHTHIAIKERKYVKEVLADEERDSNI
ncbi:MAG: YhgE/Pip domain-containing protein [Clostridiales bacterium]|nr:YhgE/Pip domain-containing protein [Clostridiales bacterium]